MKRTLILEYDDFHWKSPENCLDTIYKFVEKYPTIKLSMFTVARHSDLWLGKDKEWCAKVKDLISNGNLQLAIHGLYHHQEEFKHKTYNEAMTSLVLAESEFIEEDLPYVKVFRGPHWGINQETYNALVALNYTHVYTHPDYASLIKYNQDIYNIIYNWNLKDEAPDDEFLIGHGHTHNVCGNGIEETFDRVCSFIDNNEVEFKFVSDA